MMMLRRFMLGAVVLVAGIVGCSKDNPTGPSNPSTGTNSSHFNVTWTPGTKVFSPQEMNDVTKIDTNTLTFHLRSSNQRADSLAAGDIIVLGDYAIRRVKSVSKSGGEIVVTTDTVSLNQAMVDADIAWDQEVQLTPQLFEKSFGKGASVERIADDSLKVSFNDGAFNYDISMKLMKDKANATIVMSKSVKGIKVAEFKLDGVLNKFRSKGLVQIQNHQLLNYSNSNDQLNVDFTITAAVIGSGVNLGYSLTIPFIKAPIPGIPFLFIDYKAQVVLNASVPPDGSSNIGVKFNISGDQGFLYQGSTKAVTPTGSLKTEKVEQTKDPRTGASSPIAVSWGIGFPRIELGIPGLATSWVQSAYLIGGDYTMIPPCQQAKAQIIGSYGYSLGAFGVTIASKSGTVWNKEKVLLKAGQCP